LSGLAESLFAIPKCTVFLTVIAVIPNRL